MYMNEENERPAYYRSDIEKMLSEGIITPEELDEMKPEIIEDF